jgi:hypothetical protein
MIRLLTAPLSVAAAATKLRDTPTREAGDPRPPSELPKADAP